MKEPQYRKRYSLVAKSAALLIIFVLVVGWIDQGLMPSWKQYQRKYRRTLHKAFTNTDSRSSILPEQGVYQAELPDLRRTDRCVTCHLAIEGGPIDTLSEPFRVHPGSLLETHPVRKFGCTICHGGQGQALDKANAFARNPRNDWDQPVLQYPFIESSCGKCHLSLFTGDSLLQQSQVLERGRETFLREGCLGCHKARNVGGMLGPDLTAQGDKSRHEYNFRNIRGEQTISNWLEQPFIDPEMVSPGSRMLEFDLPKEDMEALATLVMGLSRPDLPYKYIGTNVLLELKGVRPLLPGDSLFAMLCSACHGKSGEGKPWAIYKSGVPAIGRAGFLSIASPEYVAFILRYGRTSQLMTPWAPEFSGLTPSEVSDAGRFVLSRRATNSTWSNTRRLLANGQGEFANGEQLFRSRCLTCHGERASGGLAIGFNHPDFFRAASMEYIYNTVTRGRMNTAMPSWSFLSDAEMAELLSYIRHLESTVDGQGIRTGNSVMASDMVRDPASGIRRLASGAERFHYLCSRCHGDHGEGATGPANLNKDFLRTADDPFLYRTISSGRAHTPMHGWIRQGSQEGGIDPDEIREIIAYMRSTVDTAWEYNYPGPTLGNKENGKTLFGDLCAGCHGVHGTGIKAPSLNDQVFLNAATNGFLLATITLGRVGTDMPTWGDSTNQHRALSASERNDIVAFIRGWQKVHLPVSD